MVKLFLLIRSSLQVPNQEPNHHAKQSRNGKAMGSGIRAGSNFAHLAELGNSGKQSDADTIEASA